jgi:hypothetical protein
MTTQFQVGQTYNVDREYGEFITITRRTDKSVWLKHEDGTESRKGIKILNNIEVVQSKDFNLYSNRPTEPLETTSDCETTPEPTKVPVTESKVKSLIVCDREAISDVVYSELIEAFNLKDDECLIAWGGFYRYEKPKKSLTMPGVYFVHYEHVNGRSGGNYQVKVTFDEPCTTVETPQDVAETTETTSEPSQDLATESQTFNHFEYIESHYVTRNPPGSENIYTEVPGGWNTLKSVAFTLITAWENGCLDMTVQHWITGLTRDELDTLLSVLVSMFSHAKIKSSQVNQIILGLMPTPVIVSSETQIDDETYAGILKAFDLDIYCGESVKQGHREYFAPVPRFDIEPDMYYIVSADIGEEYDTIFSVKKINPTPLTHNAPNNVIEVDFAARKRV